MTDAKLSWYITWTYAIVCQLDDSLSYNIGQGSAIHKNSTKLIHSTMACNYENGKIKWMNMLFKWVKILWLKRASSIKQQQKKIVWKHQKNFIINKSWEKSLPQPWIFNTFCVLFHYTHFHRQRRHKVDYNSFTFTPLQKREENKINCLRRLKTRGW